MKARFWIPLVLLVLLIGGTFMGLRWTGDAPPAPGTLPQHSRRAVKAKAKDKGKAKGAKELGTGTTSKDFDVDESPLEIARGLRHLATSLDEQTFARQAERLANHEVDLAFADALRLASSHPPTLTPDQQELLDWKDEAEDAVNADKRHLAELTRQLAKAPDAARDALEDQLEVAKAQLELDQDEFEAASDDLERAGGDPQARLHRLRAAREVADKEFAAHPFPALAVPGRPTLISELRDWIHLRQKTARLEEAERLMQEKGAHLEARRTSLAQSLDESWDARAEAKSKAEGFAKGKPAADRGRSREDAKATLINLRKHMDEQRILADLGKRAQDQKDLVAIYGAWGDLAEYQADQAIHGALTRLLWILFIALAVLLLGLLLDHRFKPKEGDQRTGALGLVLKVALQISGALAILLIILGIPAQTTTILGLAGAGLTVALKDVILAFLGWFMLVGRHGLRVGDWVEIKGVSGEVVEIGMLRTVLMETGGWSDTAHPTGRRVAFMNSFAIEGHFFNFSTSGQWMWDELKATVPSGQDPYPILEGLQKLVEAQTEANAKQAEGEWQKVTKRYRVQAFSTVPQLNVATTAGGIEVRVRYIARAHEKDAIRQRLNQAVMDLLHGKPSGS
jgi:small-conductance mechanosensitive channel